MLAAECECVCARTYLDRGWACMDVETHITVVVNETVRAVLLVVTVAAR